MTEVVDLEQEQVYITRRQLAKRLGLDENTIAHWPSRGYGPRPRKFGGRIRYKLTEVERWEDDQRFEGEWEDGAFHE